jgi:DNA-binding SARP family transcriptional activator
MIQLWTLGRLDLRGADGTELRVILTQPKRVALLAYLALHNPRGFISREHLLALFWPEQDAEHARSALNRALYFLRRSLGHEVILSRGDGEVGLSWDHFWCDAVAFESAVTGGAARDAVVLYRGDLLRGFHVSEAHGFDEWLDTERERMRRLAQRAGWSLAEQEERAGNFAAAAQAARWAAQRAPYDEAGVQRLIALLDRCGDRAGAIQVYDEFERLLSGELEVAPAPETRALIETVRARQRQNGVHGPAETVHAAPAAVEQRVDAPVASPSRRWSWRRSGVAAIAALVIIVGGAALLVRPRVDPHVVLISSIENRTGDAALDEAAQRATEWIVRSVTDAVESTTSPVYRKGNRVERDGSGFGAGIRVSGELYRERGRIVYRVRLIDAVYGGSVWRVPPVEARADSADDALREIAQRATGGVAALLDQGMARWFPVVTNPPTYDAFVEMLRAEIACEIGSCPSAPPL